MSAAAAARSAGVLADGAVQENVQVGICSNGGLESPLSRIQESAGRQAADASWDPLETPSFMNTQVHNIVTPRTVATAKTSASAMTHLLDSEKKLLLNQQQAEMARKDHELQQLRRALLYLSEEATAETTHRAENAGLKEALARERECRQQSDRELERALSLLKDNMAHRIAEAKGNRPEWKESFLDATRQNKALHEGLKQQEHRLREEMRIQQEQARQKYAVVIEQLRTLETEVKEEGAKQQELGQQLNSCKQQLAAEQQKHREETERLQQECNNHQRTSNQHMQVRTAHTRGEFRWPEQYHVKRW